MSSELLPHTLEYWKQPIFVDLIEKPGTTSFEMIEALYNACAADDFSQFKAIFDEWQTKDFRISELAPVFLLAIHRDNVGVVSTFLSQGQPATSSHAVNTIAAKARRVAALFQDNDWGINEASDDTLTTALAYAVTDEDMTRFLLARGADPNKQCVVDLTPLSWAAEKATLSTIKLLFEHGADVSKGQPLHHAARRKSTEETNETLAFLLDKGAPLNASMYENHPASLEIYARVGTGPAIHQASLVGNLEAVRFLLGGGANPDIQDLTGRRAVNWAREAGHLDLVTLLSG
ncbi:putative hspc200 [Aspergillus venezuelensis]